jgi:hypothetical protein
MNDTFELRELEEKAQNSQIHSDLAYLKKAAMCTHCFKEIWVAVIQRVRLLEVANIRTERSNSRSVLITNITIMCYNS